MLTIDEFVPMVRWNVDQNIAAGRSHQLGNAAYAAVEAGFVIYASTAFVVRRRRRELALLRTLGARRGQVIRAAAGEAIVVGVTASLVGLVVGLGTAGGVLRVLAARGVIPSGGAPHIGIGSLVLALTVGVAVTLVAATAPVLALYRLSPLAAFTDAAVEPGRAAGPVGGCRWRGCWSPGRRRS